MPPPRQAEPLACERVLALVGATASGKSDLALEVARRVDADVVAVDAFTVYRGMDIGTAKPTAEARERIRHHMLDVLAPDQECTVQWFQQAARAAIAAVLAAGGVPLLVGGSGLYFRAVVDDLAFPPTDPQVRAAIERRFVSDPVAAWEQLAVRDPEAAARMDRRNLRRIVRALEVIELTGHPFSHWRRAWDTYRSIYPRLRVVGVDMGRTELHARIDARVEAMFARGLIEEARQLAAGPLSDTARQAIGYSEALDHLAGWCTVDEARERTKVRTRRYAARQQRWFSSDPRVRWTPAADVVDVLVGTA